MAIVISLSEIRRIRQQVETLRRELREKELLLEQGARELAAMRHAVRPGERTAMDERELQLLAQVKATLVKKLRDTEAAIGRAKEKTAAIHRTEGRGTMNVQEKEVAVRRLEGEMVRLRADIRRTEALRGTGHDEGARSPKAERAPATERPALLLAQERDAISKKLREMNAALKNDAISKKLRDMNAALKNAGDITRLQTEITRAEQELERGRAEVKRLVGEVARLRAEAQRQKTLRGGTLALPALETERNLLQKRLGEIETATRQPQPPPRTPRIRERARREANISRINREAAELRANAARIEKNLEQQKLELAAMRRANSARNTASVAAKEALGLERDRDTLLKEIRTAESDINKSKKNIADAGNEQERHATRLDAKKNEVRRLEGEVARLRAGAVRGERDLAEMEQKLRDARRRPAA